MARALLAGLAVLDLAACLLVGYAPAIWVEALYPDRVGVVAFDDLQRAALVWGARGCLSALTAWRPSPLSLTLLAGSWLLEAPADALSAWRMASAGPWAAPALGGRAVLGLGIALILIRAARARR